jgi:threonine synthase
MFATKLKCLRCGVEYPLVTRYSCSKCNGILDVDYDYEAMRKEGLGHQFAIRKDEGMWKFKDFLPVKNKKSIVTLREGDTPLFHCERLGALMNLPHVYLKDETRNPTGSFKDRPISCAISKAREEGANTVVTSSSGNAAVAVASYAAKAGMKVIILVPSTTSRNKLLSIVCSGAILVKIKGTYSDCFNLTRELSQKYRWINLTSTFLNPFATEGDKTVAYELYQQLNFVPDWILVPTGAGPLLAGIYKGYKELKKLGVVDKLPAMVGVQAKGCAPIVRAFDRGDLEVKAWGIPRTIASGIADPLEGYSDDGTLTLKIIRESGGIAVAVDDKGIMGSTLELSRLTGIFAEPTGACSVASLRKLKEKGILKESDTVICMVTGSGFKDTHTMEEHIEIPPIELEPALKKVENFLKRKIT